MFAVSDIIRYIYIAILQILDIQLGSYYQVFAKINFKSILYFQ